jgi:hypothetical protein
MSLVDSDRDIDNAHTVEACVGQSVQQRPKSCDLKVVYVGCGDCCWRAGSIGISARVGR